MFEAEKVSVGLNGEPCTPGDILKATNASNTANDTEFGQYGSVKRIFDGLRSDIKWGCAAEHITKVKKPETSSTCSTSMPNPNQSTENAKQPLPTDDPPGFEQIPKMNAEKVKKPEQASIPKSDQSKEKIKPSAPAKTFAERWQTRKSTDSMSSSAEREFFMNFYAEWVKDRYKDEPNMRQYYDQYRQPKPDEAARTQAFFTFQKQAVTYLHSEAYQSKQSIKAAIDLVKDTANFFEAISDLTYSPGLSRFAAGLACSIKAIDGIQKAGEVASLMQQGFSMTTLTMGIGALGVVGGAVAGITRLRSGAHSGSHDNGLGMALQTIHTSIIHMWSDVRQRFEVTWNMLAALKGQLNEMDQENLNRFQTLLCVIDYYSTMTLEKLSQLHTSLHGHLQYSQQCFESYLKELSDEDAIKAVSIIQKQTEEEITEHLKTHSTTFAHWLTKKSANPARSGRLSRHYGKLSIETSTLLRELQAACAPEMSSSNAKPLGLLASLAQQIDPHIISNTALAHMINPADWVSMCGHYLRVMTLGMETIAHSPKVIQESYLHEVQAIKAVPELVMDFLTKTRESKSLWTQLIHHYLSAYQLVQENIHVLLEEKRGELNRAHGIDPEKKLLQLEQSFDENINRIQQMSEWTSWLRNQTEIASLLHDAGIESENARAMLCNKDFTSQVRAVVHTTHFLVAKKFNTVSFKITYSERPWIHPPEVNVFFAEELRMGGAPLRGTEKEYELKLSGHHAAEHPLYQVRCCFFDPRYPYDRVKVNFNAYEQSNKHAMEHMKQSVERGILEPKRKLAAREIVQRIDLHAFECARLQLLSFVKLHQPDFQVDCSAATRSIHDLLQQIEKTGSVEPMQTLLSPEFGRALLKNDLGLNALSALQSGDLETLALDQHPLWKDMAQSYANLEYLTQTIASRIEQKIQMDFEQCMQHSLKVFVKAHQQLSLQIHTLKQGLVKMHSLEQSGVLSLSSWENLKTSEQALESKFNDILKETKAFYANQGIDYQPPDEHTRPTEPFPSVTASSFLAACWKKETQALGFSLERTMQLLEQVAIQFERLAAIQIPAVLVSGETGAGKSTLVNACLGIKYQQQENEQGEVQAVPVDPKAKEPAKTGHNTKSETLFPNILLSSGELPFYWIDMAGLGDTRGEPEEISNRACMEGLQSYLSAVKGIIMVCDGDAINPKTRYGRLRETLRVVGDMIKKEPSSIAQQICLVVTRSSVSKEIIFKRLQHWEKEEYSAITKDSSQQDQAIKRVLSLLTQSPDSILLIDVTQPGAEQVLIQKIQEMPVDTVKQFDLSPVSTEMTLIKKVLTSIFGVRSELTKKITQLQQALIINLKTELQANSPQQAAEFDALQKMLCALGESEPINRVMKLIQMQKAFYEDWNSMIGTYQHLLKPWATNSHFDGDANQISTLLMAHYQELKTQQAFFDHIKKLCDLIHIGSENTSQGIPSKASSFFNKPEQPRGSSKDTSWQSMPSKTQTP